MMSLTMPWSRQQQQQPAGAGGVSTATGWIALLQEDDVALRSAALKKLLAVVSSSWHEVAECLPELEAVAEDSDGVPADTRATAAAVASRVYFHLEEPTQALRLALEAGPEHFDPMQADRNPYVERLVSAALDAYVSARKKLLDEDDDTTTEDQQQQQQKKKKKKADVVDDDGVDKDDDDALPMDQLQAMVYRLLESSCAAGHYQHALGVALEARETDKVKDVLVSSGPDLKLLSYAVSAVQQQVSSKGFRLQSLKAVAECLEGRLSSHQQQQQLLSSAEETAAYCDLVLVHQLLGNAGTVAAVLARLLKSTNDGDDRALLGLQLCFDVQDAGDQAFVKAVAAHLAQQETPPRDGVAAAADTSDEDDGAAGSSNNDVVRKRLEQAQRVLVGGFVSELSLSFLHKQSRADRLIMENLKKALEERSSGSRSSVLHNASVMCHSYLYAGTTNDSFLRDYLDWMKKASNWAKFSATASLGVVHARHVTEAMHLLEPYLPANPAAAAAGAAAGDEGGAAAAAAAAAAAVSPAGGYAEGGSLYALGLIHGSQQAGSCSAKRAEATEFLRGHLRASHANEVISHGAALAVGLTAMGTADLRIVRELKDVLDTDSAVAGEAAGMAIGMVLVGTGAGNTVPDDNALPAEKREECVELVSELKNYARETQHEKIIRGIAVGLAVMNFGQEERADATIQEMLHDRDPILRYGAQYCIALAYCGTGNRRAVRLLLHAAVSDVSDDVRMAAVLGLAFVLFKQPDRVPELVRLLLESFNPHVRYAACMAVGIAMAGTGDPEAIALLEPMLDDMTDYVRQGALQGTAMVYMMCSDATAGRKVRSFREKLAVIVTEKHQSTLTKMGAILGAGILDTAGRNAGLSLAANSTGSGSNGGGGVLFTNQTAAVGLALWLQHWHWYPCLHMWSLAITPRLTVGLNKDLKYPKNWTTICKSKPSVYAYPRKLEEKKEEKKKRVETVTLSTTAKEKARLARKRAKAGGGGGVAAAASAADKMDVVPEDAAVAAAAAGTLTEKKAGGDDDGAAAMDVDAATKDGSGSGGGKEDHVEEKQQQKPMKKKKEPEPTEFRVPNPARITVAQAAVTEFDLSQRYRPVRLQQHRPVGVVILTDTLPEQEEEDLGAVKSPSLEPEGELAPPEPFGWTPPPVKENNNKKNHNGGEGGEETKEGDGDSNDKKKEDGMGDNEEKEEGSKMETE